MKDEAQKMDAMIAAFTSKKPAEALSKQTANDASSLEVSRDAYERWLSLKGMNSGETIVAGLKYATGLLIAHHCIEAERLVTKLATASRQTHGPEHKITIEAVGLLEKCKERYVIFCMPDSTTFQALRYENGGEVCVVTGPMTTPRQQRRDDGK